MSEFTYFPKEAVRQSIPDRFEQHVRLYPQRIAVKTHEHELTYEALNRAANRIARAILDQRGEAPEPIALLLQKGAPLIAAMLGILKAGKFYVPLDPSYPQARTAFMLDDSQAGLVVTDNRMLAAARELAGGARQLLDLDGLDSSLAAENPGLTIPPDAFAYLLYTSGSTGQPKGVVENHRNVLHFTMNNTNAGQFCAEDRLTLFASCSFSASASPIYGALLNGAALYPLDVQMEGIAHLAEWLIHEEITVFHGASLFRPFAASLTGREAFPRLRLICWGGEPLTPRVVEWYKRYFAPHCVLFNSLGATEMKCFRMYRIDKETEITGSVVPVGYAVEDTEVLLLDEAGQPVPAGEIGEIAVKSEYIAPVYWRHPELTQAKFEPDPMGGNERIYRTGDLGRMLPDGCLLQLGRKDFQVKIRGYRIEIAEIEMALLSLGTIREAVVLAREDRSDDARLVAYLVPTRRPAPTVSSLRRALSATLPDYMIPSSYVILEALPVTPNGKLDRQALPAPDRLRPALETRFVAPRTPIEAALAEIWAEVLGLEQVGIHDRFLELGGDSLLAAQVIARVQRAFQEELPLRRLFESPTVAGLALVIAQSQAERVEGEGMVRMLAELEHASEEEAERLLADVARQARDG